MRVYGLNVIEQFLDDLLVGAGWLLVAGAIAAGILGASGLLVAGTGLSGVLLGIGGAGIRQNRAAGEIGCGTADDHGRSAGW